MTAPTAIPKPDERLHAAADLFRERNAAYGANYLQIGQVLQAMFPHGLFVGTPDDWRRLFMMVHRITKETRYAQNMARGQGHTDSMEDLAVYAMMANETDQMAVLAREALVSRAQRPATREELEDIFRTEPNLPLMPGETLGDGAKNSSIHQNAILEVSMVDRPAQMSGPIATPTVDRLVPRQTHEDPPEAKGSCEWRK